MNFAPSSELHRHVAFIAEKSIVTSTPVVGLVQFAVMGGNFRSSKSKSNCPSAAREASRASRVAEAFYATAKPASTRLRMSAELSSLDTSSACRGLRLSPN